MRALRRTYELLDELKERIKDRPKLRLHVNPESAVWIIMSIEETGLGGHVRVVPDPGIVEAGRAWLEEFSVEQWRAMHGLVGTRVRAQTDIGEFVGTLIELSDSEMVIDPAGDPNDRRYVYWLTIEAAPEDTSPSGPPDEER